MKITAWVTRVASTVCVSLMTVPAFPADVFFSTVGRPGGGVTAGNPLVTYTLTDEVGSLFIWSTGDQSYDTTIGMNVVSSAPGVISFSDGEVFNPDIVSDALGGAPVNVRWTDAAANDVNPDSVEAMNGVHTVGGTGILMENDGTVAPLLLRDELYDMPADAFLLAVVYYDIIGLGTTSLSIDQEDTALFVNESQQIFPAFGAATVRVVPEPSTFLLALVALGVVGGSWKWKRAA